jgi:hypothetical protein
MLTDADLREFLEWFGEHEIARVSLHVELPPLPPPPASVPLRQPVTYEVGESFRVPGALL